MSADEMLRQVAEEAYAAGRVFANSGFRWPDIPTIIARVKAAHATEQREGAGAEPYRVKPGDRLFVDFTPAMVVPTAPAQGDGEGTASESVELFRARLGIEGEQLDWMSKWLQHILALRDSREQAAERRGIRMGLERAVEVTTELPSSWDIAAKIRAEIAALDGEGE